MQTESLAHRSARLAGLYRWTGFSLHSPVPTLPAGPAVILAAHYNGLLDGFVYSALSRNMLAVTAAQWHRTWLGRLLLPAVSVTRAKDRSRGIQGSSNTAAFKAMESVVQDGYHLLFFPEGTSRLGAERLPVQAGTTLLLSRIRRTRPETPVFFTAINYEAPTRWRSRAALATDGPHQIPENRAELSEWVAQGLLRAQTQAFALTFPPRSIMWLRTRRLLGGCLLLPVWPAWPASCWAIRKFADDDNVISLWRLLGGIPVALLCFLVWLIVGILTAQWWLGPAAILSTLTGIWLWQE